MSNLQKEHLSEITKTPTHIPGFDEIARGGLPSFRSTLVSGTAGSGKTIFAAQFLANGILYENENAVFVTFEETPENITRNMRSFGWDIQEWEDNGQWVFVDASPLYETVKGGLHYDLGGLITRIEHAIRKVGAKRVSIDSLGALLFQFQNDNIIRNELFNLAHALKELDVTVLMTAERIDDYGQIARYGVEEFVTDNVIILRNVLDQEKRRRTIEILKYRGAPHQKGEFPFTILPNQGLVSVALATLEMNQSISLKRVHSGSEALNQMTCGGFFQGSIILASGATGTGKTLLVTEFMKGGAQDGEKCIFFAFEESHAQILRNAEGWNVDFTQMEKTGRLMIVGVYPEVMNLEEHLIEIKRIVNEFGPQRIAVDSLSALERISSERSLREFVIGLTAFIKEKQITAMITTTAPTIVGAGTITSAHISTITDAIILLRYVEHYGVVKRAIAVLKMRGSGHDKAIREFHINEKGLHIDELLKGITGILSGQPKAVEGLDESELTKAGR